MKPAREDEIKEKLASVGTFLSMQSALLPGEDTLSWAGDCIRTYLEGKVKSLDEAFGLCSTESKESLPAAIPNGKHNDWIATALRLIISKTPEGKEWPDTKDLANIGRFCGLGGEDKTNTDEAIASELKQILAQYDSIAIEQLNNKIKITGILDKTED